MGFGEEEHRDKGSFSPHHTKGIVLLCKKYIWSLSLVPVKSFQSPWNFLSEGIIFVIHQFSSVHSSRSVVFDSLWSYGLQPGLPVRHQLPEFTQTHVHLVGDAIQLSHPLWSPSPPSFPASGSFPVNQPLLSGGQSTGSSASTTVLPKGGQGWFPLGLTGFSLLSKGLSRVVSSPTAWQR